MARSPERRPSADPGASESRPAPRFPVVGIGASAGGLEALRALLSAIPADTGMAFIIVQHLDPAQKSHMAELLTKQTAMRVVEAEQDLPVARDCIYTIPPGSFLTLRDSRLHLEKPTQGQAVRMPIDLLFRSLAEGLGEAAVGIVLSGTGSDGTLGVRAIRGAGGLVLAQDPASAEFDAMPQSAIATGLVDYVLPPAEMAGALLSFVRQARTGGEEAGLAGEEDVEQVLRAILALLLRQAKSDFSGYKRGTVLRRVQRRMSVAQIPTLAAYLRLLQDDPEEADRLAKNMLIGVTGFFRDKEAFAELRKEVIAPLVQAKEEGTAVRVWVPGCATGEEAYSIAILLFEEMAAAGKHAPVQVFASDVDEEALALARSGVYPASIAEDVPVDLLERFFVRAEAGYRITQQLREAVVLTTQNLLTAPPFSNLDLISCRNVLIYFTAEAQDKVLSLFAFALHEGGYLFLGKSDSILGHEEFFRAITRKGRLYQRSAVPHRAVGRFQVRAGTAPIPRAREEVPQGEHQGLLALPPQILLDHFGASLVLINAGGSIVSFYGESERYLSHPTGMADLNLFSMARPRLAGRLRVGVRQAIERSAAVHLARVPLAAEGGSRRVDVTITPYLPAGGAEPLVAVIFQEVSEAEAGPTPSAAGEAGDSAALVEQLEADLRSSRAEMLAATAEFEASDEQLRAIHEEAVSVNEELQSTNEELEASKEELQSLNEELATVNTQLGERMEEVTATNNDLLNLFGATGIATIFLDKELRIRRFTPAAEGLLNLIASDVGRPIGHLSPNFTGADLAASAEAVCRNRSIVEQEVVGSDGHWYTMRAFPYRTADDRIDGVVVTLADVTRLKHSEEALEATRAEAQRRATQAEEGRQLLEAIQEAVPPLIAYLDRDLTFRRVSAQYARTAGLRREDLEGRAYLEMFPQNPDIAVLLRQALDGGEPVEVREFFRSPSRRPELGARYWDMVFMPVANSEGVTGGVVMSVLDVTDRVRQRQRVEEAERARAELAETLNSEIAHRVKNNLAMMAGLLQMQIAEQPEAEVSAVLRNAVGRLLVFADVNEQMQAVGEGDLDLLRAIRHIASANREAFAQRRVVVSVEGEAALLPYKAATNLAVVANELITNAIKHGASDTQGEMRVHVGVHRAGGNLRLSVWNSGNPIPADFDASRPRSMGLRLVRGLSAEQYGGTFSLRPHEGGTMAEVVVEEERLR